MAASKWVLGIDGGGTKCLARLETIAGEYAGEVFTGPANVAQDAATAYRSVCEACEQLQIQFGISDKEFRSIPATLGLAGVNIEKYAIVARQWRLPVDNLQITTDLHIACAGAHLRDEGALIITGTGSSAYVKTAREARIIGGHGFPLGDEASGAWLGWRAIGAALHTFDGITADSALAQHIRTHFHAQSAQEIVAQTLHFRSADYAALAPDVLALAAQDDPVATNIVRQGALYLSQLLTTIDAHQPSRIAMTGGLAPLWKDWLPPADCRKLSDALSTPVQGATLLAKAMVKEDHKLRTSENL